MTLLRTIAQMATFAIAFLFGRLIDILAAGDFRDGYILISAIAAIGAGQVWLRFFSKVRMQTIGAEIRKETRLSATDNLIDEDLEKREDSGSSIQNINAGTENLHRGIHVFTNEGIAVLTDLTISLVIFMALDVRYILYAAAYAGLYLIAEREFNKHLTYWEDRLKAVKERVAGKLTESGTHAATIRTLGIRDTVRRKSESYEQEFFETWQKKRDVSKMKAQTIKIFAALGYAGFLALLVFDVSTATITVGAVVTYAKYYESLRKALDTMTNRASLFIGIKAAIGRFMARYGRQANNTSRHKSPPADWRKISCDNLHVAYDTKQVFSGLSFEIERGERIGIRGPSGSGKSTLTRVILGNLSPTNGSIQLDKRPLQKYDVHQLLTVVPQEPSIFNTTIRENITFSPDADEGKVSEAVRIARLDTVLKRLPEGIDTRVGEEGYTLSGGERQRIAIARAIYKDTPVILLDEGTSSLDTRTEKAIMKDLTAMDDVTLIIIAHHERTLRWTERRIDLSKKNHTNATKAESENRVSLEKGRPRRNHTWPRATIRLYRDYDTSYTRPLAVVRVQATLRPIG